jgi:hypothetical protein
MCSNMCCISVDGRRSLLGWPRQKLYDMTFLAGIEAEVTMLVVVLLVDDNDDDGIAAATENNGSLPIARYEKRPNNDRISIDVTECRILRYPIALGRQKEYSSNTRIRYRKSSSYPKLSKSWRSFAASILSKQHFTFFEHDECIRGRTRIITTPVFKKILLVLLINLHVEISDGASMDKK